MKYTATTKNHSLELEVQQGKVMFKGHEVDCQILSQSVGEVVLLIDNQVFRVQSLAKAEEGNDQHAHINGRKTSIRIQSETDILLEKMGGAGGGQHASKNIKAPMPGLIVKLLISQGDTVEKGQVLLNFEAMKMENQLKSPGPGTIKSILVAPGDKVEKNQMLIEMA